MPVNSVLKDMTEKMSKAVEYVHHEFATIKNRQGITSTCRKHCN